MGARDHRCDIRKGLKTEQVVPPTVDFVHWVAGGGGGHKHGSSPNFVWETLRCALITCVSQTVLGSVFTSPLELCLILQLVLGMMLPRYVEHPDNM